MVRSENAMWEASLRTSWYLPPGGKFLKTCMRLSGVTSGVMKAVSLVPVIRSHGMVTLENGFLVEVDSGASLPFDLGMLGLMAKAALMRLSVNFWPCMGNDWPDRAWVVMAP